MKYSSKSLSLFGDLSRLTITPRAFGMVVGCRNELLLCPPSPGRENEDNEPLLLKEENYEYDLMGERARDDSATVRRKMKEVCGGCHLAFGIREKQDRFQVVTSGKVILLHPDNLACALKVIFPALTKSMPRNEAKRLVAQHLKPVEG